MKTIILHTQNLNVAEQIASELNAKLEPRTTHFRLQIPQTLTLEKLRKRFQIDINYLPETFDFSKLALLVSDMDSTLIDIECIDEIADFAQVKPQVADITHRAMLGELDFNRALIERVNLLKNLSVEVLEKVYQQKLNINLGGRELIDFLHQKGVKTAVVSGGFTYFTSRLANDLNLDYSRANTLEVVDNRLTGKLQGKIINAQAKADFVRELCVKYSIDLGQVLTIGDGANDLEMMKIAGLSLAYHAKPEVIKSANIVISYGGLDKIIDLFEGDYAS
jgi:phosphoserine phosphatase